jgi:hypothetical protein
MKILTLWIPATCLVLAVINTFFPIPYFYEELGIIENLTVIFLLMAVGFLVFGVRNFKSRGLLDQILWVMLVVGSVYFAGEEISWGQHFLGFETPESYKATNYQNELNLHNTEGIVGDLLNRIPRNILTAGIFLGGIIFPFCKPRLPKWMRRYIPGKAIVLLSVLAVFISVPEKIIKDREKTGRDRKGGQEMKHFEARFDGGEMKEMYIGLFILVFTMNFVALLKKEELLAERPQFEV